MTRKLRVYSRQRGIVLIMTMIILVVFASLAVSMSSLSDIKFNRSGLEDVPAGFVPQIVLFYDSTSYKEISAFN